VSISQACRIVDLERKTYRYQPKKKPDDKVLEMLLKTLSAQHPTYGFGKLFNLIRLKIKLLIISEFTACIVI